MTLILEQIHTAGIAQLSYLIGDDEEGTAAVIDPRPDVDIYLELAREKQLSITHIFETHIHADLVSGARELCRRTESAKIYLSVEEDPNYGFEHEPIRAGDTFAFGSTRITVHHTPGHTPEHVSFLLAEKGKSDTPWGVLTGDSLFVNSAGRPDLLGTDEAEELAQKLYRTLRNFYLELPDSVIIYPGHGQGSPCGADIGDRLTSTIGYERSFNKFLQLEDKADFVEYVLETAPPAPTYYPRMKEINEVGPEVLGNLPTVPGLPPEQFRQACQDRKNVLIDTRTMLAFGGGHIEGAINIGGDPMLSIWAGWLLEPEQPILLVLDSDESLHEIVRLLVRTGYTSFAGYLVGGMTAWSNAGLPMTSVTQMTVHDLKKSGDSLQVLDVRAPDEWQAGHIPNAHHLFLGELQDKLDQLEKNRRTAVYCNSGYRASIATSLMLRAGFNHIANVPGSWQAWTNAGYPVEKPAGEFAEDKEEQKS